ncbi:MAG: dicarboxylate/amino acid:cation symporter [Bacteroidetes bacterium]|nr:dicarboxylate/amino acid:cation symporter [Bacteroidota bacterium]
MSAPVSSGKGMPLHTKILIGLVVGAVLGLLFHSFAPQNLNDAVNRYVAYPIGQVFFRMLYMVVMPLVFASIALGVAGLGDLKAAGRVGSKSLAYFFATTFVAAALGLMMVNLIEPGNHLDTAVRDGLIQEYAGEAATKVEASQRATESFGIETIVNIVTRNPIKSAADGDMLGVIFFGLMFGIALTMLAREKAAPMIQWLDALNEVVVKIVELAMRIAPYGVAALIFGVTSKFGFGLMQTLGLYVVTVLGALLLHTLLTIPAILRFIVGMNPVTFFSRIRSSIITAFSTSSSAATLPTNLAVAEQNLGIPPQIGGFVLPLGSTMCMNGTAIFEGITVLFLAQLFDVDLSLGEQIIVVVMSVLTAVGAAGVPGGSIPLLVGIMTMFGIPGEAIGIVLGVDRILDMSRTTVNVIGDMSATAFVGKSEGVWTPAMLPSQDAIPADEDL